MLAAFNLGDPRFDAQRDLLLAAIREQEPLRALNYARVIAMVASATPLSRISREPLLEGIGCPENTVEVIEAVKQRLARSTQILPPDVQVEVIQDCNLGVGAVGQI